MFDYTINKSLIPPYKNTGLRSGSFAVDSRGQIRKINYKGQPCTNCKCSGCKFRNVCGGVQLGSSEGPGINVNPNYKVAGERAKSAGIFLRNIKNRTAGGEYLGTQDIIDVMKYPAMLSIISPIAAIIGIPYASLQVYKSVSGKTDSEIRQTLMDPETEQKIKDTTKKIIKNGTDILEKGVELPTNILDALNKSLGGIGTTIEMLPWIIGGVLILAVIFLFMNPGVVKR